MSGSKLLLEKLQDSVALEDARVQRGLTAAQRAARAGRLTASRVACLMTGDKEAIMNLWREMVGDPSYVEEDLSGVWAVQLGATTEQLNLDWYQRKFGLVTRRGEVVLREDWQACTLDGWCGNHPIECKHVGGFERLEVIIGRYQPQMQWQMLVTGAAQCALSVIMGAQEPVVEMVQFDTEYTIELQERAKAFIACVRSLTPPVTLDPVPAPVPPSKMRTYEMNTNEWASEAHVWLENRVAAKTFAAAEKQLKAMVPADAAKCHGFGIEIVRNRVGNLSARPLS